MSIKEEKVLWAFYGCAGTHHATLPGLPLSFGLGQEGVILAQRFPILVRHDGRDFAFLAFLVVP